MTCLINIKIQYSFYCNKIFETQIQGQIFFNEGVILEKYIDIEIDIHILHIKNYNI